ncbi:MAG: peptide-methionine (S)-S-oxide reductase MsrA [Brevinema sp.]
MNSKKIVLAGGCFWGVEKFLSLIKGVINTETAYVNGDTTNPTYEQVCRGSNHTEAVLVEYDGDQVSLETLLDYFYQVIDPISINKQGNDVGVQYRTGIYYEDPADKVLIFQSLAKLQQSYTQKIAIEVETIKNYTRAETYHQQYLDKNPMGYCHISKSSFDKARQSHQ